MEKKRLGLWAPILVVAAAVLMLGVSTEGVEAGKNNANGATAGSGTLTVSPNPVPFGSTAILISGSGFRGGQALQVGIWGGIPSYYVTTDSNGNFLLPYIPGSGSFDTAGPYTAFAAKFKGNRLVTLAEASFTVCSTNPC